MLEAQLRLKLDMFFKLTALPPVNSLVSPKQCRHRSGQLFLKCLQIDPTKTAHTGAAVMLKGFSKIKSDVI